MRKRNRIYGIGENACCFKHGQCINGVSRLYTVWSHMIYRCEKVTDPAYKNYGGRGISVCREWHDPKMFFEWAQQNGYNDNLTIDRIKNDENYCPENCQFITLRENIMKKPKRFMCGVYKSKSGNWQVFLGKRINGKDLFFRSGTYKCLAFALLKRDELKDKLLLL